MTTRRADLMIAAIAVALAAVIMLATLGAAGSATPAGSGEPIPNPSRPVRAPASAAVVASTPALGGPARSPGSPAASPLPRPAAAAGGTPAPFIQTFAAQPGARPKPALPSPTATLPIPVNVDGCDHGYGTRTQCVPWTFPAGVTDKCAWLAAHGFIRLTVTGTDRHHLDPEGNGTACG